MKRVCTGRNPRDTGPCQSTAGAGFDTCGRCGKRRKPRAAKVVSAYETLGLHDPFDAHPLDAVDAAEQHEISERALDAVSESILDANSDADLMDDAALGAAFVDEVAAFHAKRDDVPAIVAPCRDEDAATGVVSGALDHEDDARELDSPTQHPTGRRSFHLAQMDCVAFLRSLGDETIDLVVTDPAYESLEKHRAIGTTTRLTADWFEIFKNVRFPELLAELYRVLRDDRHVYIYCDEPTMHVLHAVMHVWDGEKFVLSPAARELFPFTWWKALTWSKTKKDSDEPAAGMGYHYRASQECIVFLEKGKRRLANLGICDVLTAPRVKGYPTEKPVSISRTLIEQSCPPGGLVLDCFMGSASVGEAAFLAGCDFVGCDVADKSIALGRARLERAGGVEGGPPPGPMPAAQGSLFG